MPFNPVILIEEFPDNTVTSKPKVWFAFAAALLVLSTPKKILLFVCVSVNVPVSEPNVPSLLPESASPVSGLASPKLMAKI